DNLSDSDEINVHLTNPTLADTDGDNLSDSDEINVHLTNPTLADSDDDGLSDYIEITFVAGGTGGYGYVTDPLDPDTDGDGLTDGNEVLVRGLDPTDDDMDDDGRSDGFEVTVDRTTNNYFITDPRNSDTDGDGTNDRDDSCPTIVGVTCTDRLYAEIAGFQGVFPYADGTAAYTLEFTLYTAFSDLPAENVVVTLSSNNPAITFDSATYTTGSLMDEEGRVTANLTSTESGIFPITISATGLDEGTVAWVQFQGGDLSTQVSVHPETELISIGQAAFFDVTVTNESQVDVNNGRVTLSIPDTQGFIDSYELLAGGEVPPENVLYEDSQTVTLILPSLTPNETYQLRVIVQSAVNINLGSRPRPMDIALTAETLLSPDNDLTDNRRFATSTVALDTPIGNPSQGGMYASETGLQVNFTSTTAKVGDRIDVPFTITNATGQPIYNVEITTAGLSAAPNSDLSVIVTYPDVKKIGYLDNGGQTFSAQWQYLIRPDSPASYDFTVTAIQADGRLIYNTVTVDDTDDGESVLDIQGPGLTVQFSPATVMLGELEAATTVNVTATITNNDNRSDPAIITMIEEASGNAVQLDPNNPNATEIQIG
ncbi:MAG: hypothetical protein AAGK74_01560, partial [Chloroflexota bacterium]